MGPTQQVPSSLYQNGIGINQLWFICTWAGLLFFSFFPNVSPVPLSSDTQPIALLFAGAIFFTYAPYASVRPAVWLLGLLACIATIVILTLDGVSFYALRGLFNYLSLFFGTYAVYVAAQKLGSKRIMQAVDAALVLYFIAAVLQILIHRDIFQSITSIVRTSNGRGMTSLATEPAIYACFIWLLYAVSLIYQKPVLSWRLGLVILQVVLLSASGIGVVILLMVGGLIALTSSKPKQLLALGVFVLLGIASVYIFWDKLSGIRYVALLSFIFENPTLIFVDTSASERASHLLFSIGSLYFNHGLPQGVASWPEYYDIIISDWSHIFPSGGPGERILCGYGLILYEMGWFGLLLPGLILQASWQLFRGKPLVYFVVFNAIIHSVLMVNLPFGSPIIAAVLGILLWQSYQSRPDVVAIPLDNEPHYRTR